MAVDMYDTRTMLEALEKTFPPQSGLLDLFFSKQDTSMSEYVDIDIYKQKRRLAPFVNPRKEGKVIERTGFTTFTFKPPYIKEKMQTNSADILKRAAGQNIYVKGTSPAQKAQQQLGKDTAELQDMIVRREEWMASQALTTGKVSCVGDGIDAEIDFRMAESHKVSPDVDWNETTAGIIKNLTDWAEIIVQDSGLNPDAIVFGKDVASTFMENEKIQKLLDNRRIDGSSISPLAQSSPDKKLPPGIRYFGHVRLPGLDSDIYTYSSYYCDDEGELHNMMPSNGVIMGSTQARATRHYGAIQDLKWDGGLASVRFFPKSWEVEDPSGRWLMLQSAPVPVPHDVDAFLYAEVLPAA